MNAGFTLARQFCQHRLLPNPWKSAQRNALGRQLDPAAFLVTHTWIPTMVLLVLDDPDDPTPYWLVSTRHPEALLDSLFDR